MVTHVGITEKQVEEIAGKVFDKKMKVLEKKLDFTIKNITEQREEIAKITRLLLGEEGIISVEDTLSYRARVAHQFAAENIIAMKDLKEVQKWYNHWNVPQPGCSKSNFDKIGDLIRLYDRVTWLVGIIGVATVINALLFVKQFI